MARGSASDYPWTPLAASHAALKARAGDLDGRAAILDYGDAAAEVRAVRQAAGLLDLSAHGRVAARGRDAASFLGRMLSNEIERLSPGDGRHALFLTDRGHIQLDLWAYRRVDDVLLETEPELRDAVQATLGRFVISDDVVLDDLTLATAHLSLQGPSARRILAAARLLPERDPLDALYRHASVDAETVHPTVVRRDRFGEEGFDLIVPRDEAERLWNEILRVGGPLGLGPVGERAAETLRLETGLPRWGREFGDEALPVEVGLEDAIDYEKGCYAGQEAVARATFVGRVQWRLAALVLEDGVTDAPVPGTHLSAASPATPGPRAGEDGDDSSGRTRRPREAAGVVTSSAWSPTLGTAVALAIVRRAHAEPGTVLSLPDGRRATVRARPPYAGGGIVPIGTPHPLAR